MSVSEKAVTFTLPPTIGQLLLGVNALYVIHGSETRLFFLEDNGVLSITTEDPDARS